MNQSSISQFDESDAIAIDRWPLMCSGALVLMGLTRNPLPRLTLLVTGGYLICRSVTRISRSTGEREQRPRRVPLPAGGSSSPGSGSSTGMEERWTADKGHRPAERSPGSGQPAYASSGGQFTAEQGCSSADIPPRPEEEVRDQVEEAIDESFPASDPPSYMGGGTATPSSHR